MCILHIVSGVKNGMLWNYIQREVCKTEGDHIIIVFANIQHKQRQMYGT